MAGEERGTDPGLVRFSYGCAPERRAWFACGRIKLNARGIAVLTGTDEINAITGAVIAAAVRIHQVLGPGLLESVYEVVLARDLAHAGLEVERQKPITFVFEGTRFDEGFRLDLLINDLVIVEIKATQAHHPVFARQLMTYLKLTDKRVGLVLNFGHSTMKEGIIRIVA